MVGKCKVNETSNVVLFYVLYAMSKIKSLQSIIDSTASSLSLDIICGPNSTLFIRIVAFAIALKDKYLQKNCPSSISESR